MAKMGVLFLPSGPGLNSGPAKLFLAETLEAAGPTVFWNEPSVQRGETLPSDDGALWDGVVRSLERAAATLEGRFAIVTESFGSILAEALYARMGAESRARVAGILHTPPVLDLLAAFRRVLELGRADFVADGDSVRAARMAAIIGEAEKDSRIDSAALHRGIALAFESPRLMSHYFRSAEILERWASGFGTPGFAPEPEMRDRILRGMAVRNAAATTTFAPDVPTWVCGGGSDPYQTPDDFTRAIRGANRQTRRFPVEWRAFPEAGHYPHVDAFARWADEVWRPFRDSL